MKIVFGHGLDGECWHPEFAKRQARFGESIAGEARLLQTLETAIGLLKPQTGKADRTLAYMAALDSLKSNACFYQNSFVADPIGVARHLLAIRDELCMAGWDGKLDFSIPRITTLKKVEAEFVKSEKDGLPDRLSKIIESIKIRRCSAISQIELVDPADSFSNLWRQILDLLKVSGTEIVPVGIESTAVKKEGDLASLIEGQTTRRFETPRGDGSFGFLIGQNPWSAARWLAAWLASQREQKNLNHETVIIVPPRYRHILASAFLERDLPFGVSGMRTSVSRPALQVLVLAIALAWAPQNLKAAMALLLLPTSPIPKRVGSRLAQALNQSPALGGPEWDKAMEEGLKAIREKDEEGEAAVKKARDRIESWLPKNLVDRSKGMNKDQLIEICTRVSSWSQGLGKVRDLASYNQVAMIADDLIRVVRNSEKETLSAENISRLLNEVAGYGVSYEGAVADAGGPTIVSGPEQVLGEAKTIVWWDFSQGISRMPQRSFWSITEQENLKKAGVFLPSLSSQLKIRNSQWVRSLQASECFLGVTFDTSAEKEEEHLHPFSDQFLPAGAEERKIWFREIMIKPGISTNKLTEQFENECGVKEVLLKTSVWVPKEDWEPKVKINLRAKESPSSIQELLGCSLAYTLDYAAGLKGGMNEDLSKDNLLAGNIAHKVFEKLFPKGSTPNLDKIEAEALILLDRIILENAGILLSPEHHFEYVELKRNIRPAALAYAKFLIANNLEVIEVEMDVSGELDNGLKIGGRLDHALGREGKILLVVDHKWGGGKYKAQDLRDGAALQPALYSYLLSTGKEHYPSIGYFIFSEALTIILGGEWKEAQIVEGPTPREISTNVIGGLKEKIKILNKGIFAADGLSEGHDQAIWKAGCPYCEFKTICGEKWS